MTFQAGGGFPCFRDVAATSSGVTLKFPQMTIWVSIRTSANVTVFASAEDMAADKHGWLITTTTPFTGPLECRSLFFKAATTATVNVAAALRKS